MDLNGLKYALSVLSLIALVLALVSYFSHNIHLAVILMIVGVVLKLGELIIRFTHKRN